MDIKKYKKFKAQALKIEDGLLNLPNPGTEEHNQLAKEILSLLSSVDEAYTCLGLYAILQTLPELLIKIHPVLGTKAIEWIEPKDYNPNNPDSLDWDKSTWTTLFPRLAQITGVGNVDLLQNKYEDLLKESEAWNQFISAHSIFFHDHLLVKEIVDLWMDFEMLQKLVSYGPEWKNYEFLKFLEYRTETRTVLLSKSTVKTVVITKAIFVNSETGKEVPLSLNFIKENLIRNWYKDREEFCLRNRYGSQAIKMHFGNPVKS